MAKFHLGRLVATPAALSAIQRVRKAPMEFLIRHQQGDWGDIGDEDRQSNEDALTLGERLLSSYTLSDGVKIWIITEWDRSVTTILLPSDY